MNATLAAGYFSEALEGEGPGGERENVQFYHATSGTRLTFSTAAINTAQEELAASEWHR